MSEKNWRRVKPGLYVTEGAQGTVRRRRDARWEWKVFPLKSWSAHKYETLKAACAAAEAQMHHDPEEEE